MSPVLRKRLPVLHEGSPAQRKSIRLCHLNRHRRQACVMALIPVVAVWGLRYPIETSWRLWFEIALVTALTACLGWMNTRTRIPRFSTLGLRACLVAAIIVTPLVSLIASRFSGVAVAHELASLSMIGGLSLALALTSRTGRNLSMSMVASGFLALFTVSISDDPRAVLLGILWIAVCLWHLIAGHWERLEVCMPENVCRGWTVRPVTLLIGVTCFTLGGLTVHQRWDDAQRLTQGVMPTSGGSQWSDPGARSGVGNGDAVIAAQQHAETFGAVESDLFLESTEMSLYDMFSDMLGETKVNKHSEKSQGLISDQVIESHHQQAESHVGGQSFSVQRQAPRHSTGLRDAVGNDVLQWIGPTGIRLATERYDSFDGVEWSQTGEQATQPLAARVVEGQTWFLNPLAGSIDEHDSILSGVLKVIRLDSTRVPAPMLTAAVHIRDVDRDDFFAIEQDGSLDMPGRSKIPPLTVLRMISHQLMEDDLLQPDSFRENVPGIDSMTEGTRLAELLAEQWVGSAQQPFEKMNRITESLRREFVLDRSDASNSDDPLHEFLSRRSGGDHLFATTAAVMGRAIGLQTRLVTGFYVPSSGFDFAAGHTSIGPQDVHAWIEVQLTDGRWIAIEPTPGFEPAHYRASLWLQSRRLAAANWHLLMIALGLGWGLHRTRVLWIELVLRLVWLLSRPLGPRLRLRLFFRVLEWRARVANRSRAAGVSQRDWILSVVQGDAVLADRVRSSCDAADRMIFGDRQLADAGQWRAEADRLVATLSTNFFRRTETPLFRRTETPLVRRTETPLFRRTETPPSIGSTP